MAIQTKYPQRPNSINFENVAGRGMQLSVLIGNRKYYTHLNPNPINPDFYAKNKDHGRSIGGNYSSITDMESLEGRGSSAVTELRGNTNTGLLTLTAGPTGILDALQAESKLTYNSSIDQLEIKTATGKNIPALKINNEVASTDADAAIRLDTSENTFCIGVSNSQPSGGGFVISHGDDLDGTHRFLISRTGNVGIDGMVGIGVNSPETLLHLGTPTEELGIVDAGSAGATEQDWILVEVGKIRGYIRVYSST